MTLCYKSADILIGTLGCAENCERDVATSGPIDDRLLTEKVALATGESADQRRARSRRPSCQGQRERAFVWRFKPIGIEANIVKPPDVRLVEPFGHRGIVLFVVRNVNVFEE